jgi:hypothetical protein
MNEDLGRYVSQGMKSASRQSPSDRRATTRTVDLNSESRLMSILKHWWMVIHTSLQQFNIPIPRQARRTDRQSVCHLSSDPERANVLLCLQRCRCVKPSGIPCRVRSWLRQSVSHRCSQTQCCFTAAFESSFPWRSPLCDLSEQPFNRDG